MRRLKPLVFLLPVVLNNYGCGLENITYLNPPGNPTISGTTFTIKATSKNDEAEFLGFEVYYKFYSNLSAFPPDVSDIDDLKSNGFLPVCSSTDSVSGTYVNHTKPLFPVPEAQRGDTFDITITFLTPTMPDSPQPEILFNGSPPGFGIRRDIADNTDGSSPTYGHGKPFVRINAGYDAYAANDTDVQAVWSASQVWLVMYAMSYGRENITTDLYSPPVYLGYIQIYIHQ